jgi:hypothetical protein
MDGWTDRARLGRPKKAGKPSSETKSWLTCCYGMGYPQAPIFGRGSHLYEVNSVLFCSCAVTRTKVEQNPKIREAAVMWIKDAAAGAGLIIFMVSSFVLASGAHAVMAIL